jgi:hypothetical protein
VGTETEFITSASLHQKDETGAGCGTKGEEQNCMLGFMGKPEGRHRLEENSMKGII